MPFDPGLARRLEDLITNEFSDIHGFKENRMMGGFGYLLNGNMCIGIFKDTLIIRIGPEKADEIMDPPHIRPMDFTGKVMKGWATIAPEAMTEEDELYTFCKLAVDFVRTLPIKT